MATTCAMTRRTQSSSASTRQRKRQKAGSIRCSGPPGFREYPNAFEIARYEVDRDEWSEGWVEVE
jgi:hypothetical protein